MSLNYQPQIDFGTGCIVCTEALIRWHHPELGFVPPGEFIPLVEETNLIEPISEWVLQTACEQSKAWLDARLSSLRMAVNLSGRQFMRKDLPRQIGLILEKMGFPADKLEIEMTEEGIFMQNAENAAITSTIINIGHALHMQVIAEGTETAEQLEFLQDQGCDMRQGFLFSPPLPAAHFSTLHNSAQEGNKKVAVCLKYPERV